MPENVKESREEEFDVKQIAEAFGRVFPHYKVSVKRGENEYKDRYVLYLKDPADNQKEYHLAHLFPKKEETTGESYYEAHVFPNVIIAADAFHGTHPISEHPPVTDIRLLQELTDSILNRMDDLDIIYLTYPEVGNTEKPFILLLYRNTEERKDVKQIAEAFGRVFPYYKVKRGKNEYKDRYVLYLIDSANNPANNPADNQKEYHLAHLFPKKDETTGKSYYEAHVFPNVIIAANAFRGFVRLSEHYTIHGPHLTSEHPPEIDGFFLDNLIDSMLNNLRDFLKYFDIEYITYVDAYNTEEPFILHLYKNDLLLRYR